MGLPAMSGNRVPSESTYLLKVELEPGVPVNTAVSFCHFQIRLSSTSDFLEQTCFLRPLVIELFLQLRDLGLELRDSLVLFPELGRVVEGLFRKVFRRLCVLDRVFVRFLQLLRSTRSIAV